MLSPLKTFCFLVFWAVPHWVSGTAAEPVGPKIKVGFIYVGPVTDFGWTYAQDQGRLKLQKQLPWVETSYVESVTEGDVESYIDQMVDQGVKVIFTTSTTFMDGTLSAAINHPDVMFFNASGYKHAPNLATYGADDYQCFYLEGLAAGALSKNGKAGCVSGYPTPDVIRQVDAFAIGLHEIAPKAQVLNRWLNSWYDPPAAKEAGEALTAEGVDVLVTNLDSLTIPEIAEQHHLPTNGIAYGAYSAAPHYLIAGGHCDWAVGYIDILRKVRSGIYTPHNLQNVDLWWRLSDKAVECAYQPGVPLNPAYKDPMRAVFVSDGHGGKISAYDLFVQRLAQMSANPPQFEPFTGPMTDSDGRVQLALGSVATKAQLFSLTWRLPSVLGDWPSK